jgi:hypothetical protein
MNAISAGRQDDMREGMRRLAQQLAVLGPLLEDHRVHLPAWSVVATRVD